MLSNIMWYNHLNRLNILNVTAILDFSKKLLQIQKDSQNYNYKIYRSSYTGNRTSDFARQGCLLSGVRLTFRTLARRQLPVFGALSLRVSLVNTCTNLIAHVEHFFVSEKRDFLGQQQQQQPRIYIYMRRKS